MLLKKEPKIIQTALEVIQLEAESILHLKHFIDKEFETVVNKIYKSKGRVVVTGIGKSAIIANKIVATLNSTGTPAMFMHAADAIHGDLGMMQEDDIVICISKSGESSEIKVLVSLIHQAGNLLIAMTGNVKSFLAKKSNHVLNTTVAKEACPNNLAPTTSTTAQLVMGDALAVCLLKMRGFTADDFAKYHPGGALGKQLYLKVDDLYPLNQKPMVSSDATINKVILEISKKRLGATAVIDAKENLLGIITDGDLRRMLNNDIDIKKAKAKDVMTKNPVHAQSGELAVNVLTLMRKHNITQVPVLNKKKYLGMVHVHDLLKEGLV
jgi:arabinose-5-phosphate isomerase